jgi:geranylgeranyl diphosphate synthase type II
MDVLHPPINREDFESQMMSMCCDELTDACNEASQILAPIKYVLSSTGKRVRAALCIAAYRYAHKFPCTSNINNVIRMAIAVEIVHSASLIMDDLPCMDNALVRRAKPCVHIVYGESIAVLVASTIIMIASQIAIKCNQPIMCSHLLSSEMACAQIRMAVGQAMDVQPHEKISKAFIQRVHAEKTVPLFCASVVCGAICGGADEDCVSRVRQFAEKLGAAFQIVDDIIDVTYTDAQAGKSTNIDDGKANYARVVGLQTAKADVIRLTNEAIEYLECEEECDLARIALSLIDKL